MVSDRTNACELTRVTRFWQASNGAAAAAAASFGHLEALGGVGDNRPGIGHNGGFGGSGLPDHRQTSAAYVKNPRGNSCIGNREEKAVTARPQAMPLSSAFGRGGWETATPHGQPHRPLPSYLPGGARHPQGLPEPAARDGPAPWSWKPKGGEPKRNPTHRAFRTVGAQVRRRAAQAFRGS